MIKQEHFSCEIVNNAELQQYTTWQIGGAAEYLAFPRNKTDLKELLEYAWENGIKTHVMGNGSNLLVADEGVQGLVINTLAMKELVFMEDQVKVSAGVLVPSLVQQAAKRGLGGLEWAAGIPASVGGAVAMNAGAEKMEMLDYVQRVGAFDLKGKEISFSPKELKGGYRKTILAEKKYIVYEAEMKLVKEDKQVVEEKIKVNLQKRHSAQPVADKNCGSVFKNPPGLLAWKLIESVSGQELQIGKVKVSEKHVNFINNLGGGSAADVLELVQELQRRVYERYQIKLEREFKILSNDDC